MNKKGGFAGGMLLILLGIVFFLRQYIPLLSHLYSWPSILVGLGLAFLLAALLSQVSELAIPACIIGGMGCIFYYQVYTGNWGSWAYVWTLIPGFVGLGIILSNFLSPVRTNDRSGWILIFLSLASFVVFGGAWILGPELSKYWPAILIILGIMILLRPLVRSKR
jgi:hypothetical protein